MGTGPEIDPHLWFKSHNEGHKCHLIGNCHTFPGRMLAWDPNQRVEFCVSANEITESSSETTFWVAGFLAGNEPNPPDDTEDPAGFEHWLELRSHFNREEIWRVRITDEDSSPDA